MARRATWRWFAPLVLLALLVAIVPRVVAAAPNERCFDATGYCVAGDILRFWQQNGGLPVFGLPLTPLQSEVVEGRMVQVQWFERHRLELHEAQPWPYRVQLGRLGADSLARSGRDPGAEAPAPPQAACRSFPETGRQLCGEFLRAGRASGVELDGRRGTSEAESLALFGLPLTEAQPEMLADGQVYLVQWFERARMELHPELPAQHRVLLGLLGAELGPRAAAPPVRRFDPPTRIAIPAIAMDRPLIPTGLDAQHVPIVPKHDVAWYEHSATPGQGENVVLWGHVLRFTEAPHIPAPFARVKELRPGARITITGRSGATYRYVVERQVWARPDEVAYILPQGREVLTLVSCIGDRVIQNGEVVEMTHRLITTAAPEG
ncbi:MAG: class F sortase [Chloroflexi bacterium]|nr:class F sortase [Chloroflexota bacterium]